jgi:hypothetical protein
LQVVPTADHIYDPTNTHKLTKGPSSFYTQRHHMRDFAASFFLCFKIATFVLMKDCLALN